MERGEMSKSEVKSRIMKIKEAGFLKELLIHSAKDTVVAIQCIVQIDTLCG